MKLTLADITNFFFPSAVTTIVSNNDAIEAALENTLSRDGTYPNEMHTVLDMNNNQILNVPPPNVDTDVARLGDVKAVLGAIADQNSDGVAAEALARIQGDITNAGLANAAQSTANTASSKADTAIANSYYNNLAQATTTVEAFGGGQGGDDTLPLNQALVATKLIDFQPKVYNISGTVTPIGTLNVAKINSTPTQTQLVSNIGDAIVRNRSGRLIGLQKNHRLQSCYSGTYPRLTQATTITTGNVVAPPLSTAKPIDIDTIAMWYGDWGLDWYRQQTGIGSRPFDGWYDGLWNVPTNTSITSDHGIYDPARASILGCYQNDDVNTLDTQAYWLREAGVAVICPVAFNFNISTWGNSNDRNLWIYRLFNTPNGKNLKYIMWGRTTEFTDPDGPVVATPSDIQSQWSTLWFSLAPAYPNNYVMVSGGKRYFTIYTWNLERLRQIFDSGSSSTNFAAWLKIRADEVRSVGYDGLAVLAHTPVDNSIMDRSALLANNVLHMQMAYGGPADSTALGGTSYSAYVNGYSPPTSGKILSVSTALKIVNPLPPSTYFDYPGTTPDLFRQLAAKAYRWIKSHPNLPQMLSVYNVSEWAEGGPGLHPNKQDGFGYLDALRSASLSA